MSAGLLHDWANILVLTVITVLSVLGVLSGEDRMWGNSRLSVGQDSAVHRVVISLTLAYLISDAVWIALQPAMARISVSKLYVEYNIQSLAAHVR